jgi:hypothetical protein
MHLNFLLDLAGTGGKALRKFLFPIHAYMPRELQVSTSITPKELIEYAVTAWNIDLTIRCVDEKKCPSPLYLTQEKTIVMSERFAQEKTLIACLQATHVLSHAMDKQIGTPMSGRHVEVSMAIDWEYYVLLGYHVVVVILFFGILVLGYFYNSLPPWAQKFFYYDMAAFFFLGLPVGLLGLLEGGLGLFEKAFYLTSEMKAEKRACLWIIDLLVDSGAMKGQISQGLAYAMTRYLERYGIWREDYEPCVIVYEK